MKLFQPLREIIPFLVGYANLEEFGFVAPNEFRNSLCRFTSFLGYVVLVSGTISSGGFLAFEAESFEEIHDHFYEFATGLNDTFFFICMHYMCRQFFELNDNYEHIIKRRKLPSYNVKKICIFFKRPILEYLILKGQITTKNGKYTKKHVDSLKYRPIVFILAT